MMVRGLDLSCEISALDRIYQELRNEPVRGSEKTIWIGNSLRPETLWEESDLAGEDMPQVAFEAINDCLD